jgi:hypothetical protein
MPLPETLYFYFVNDIGCFPIYNGIIRDFYFFYGPNSFKGTLIDINSEIDCDPSCWTCSAPLDLNKCDLDISIDYPSTNIIDLCPQNSSYDNLKKICVCISGELIKFY